MKLHTFNKMSAIDQAETLGKSGVIVATRIEKEFKILLLQLHSFYVEIYLMHATRKIVKSRSFSNTEQLKPYLDKIDLSSII